MASERATRAAYAAPPAPSPEDMAQPPPSAWLPPAATAGVPAGGVSAGDTVAPPSLKPAFEPPFPVENEPPSSKVGHAMGIAPPSAV
jgi:hypothetical protein